MERGAEWDLIVILYNVHNNTIHICYYTYTVLYTYSDIMFIMVSVLVLKIYKISQSKIVI